MGEKTISYRNHSVLAKILESVDGKIATSIHSGYRAAILNRVKAPATLIAIERIVLPKWQVGSFWLVEKRVDWVRLVLSENRSARKIGLAGLGTLEKQAKSLARNHIDLT